MQTVDFGCMTTERNKSHGYAFEFWTLHKSLTPLPNTRGAAVVSDVYYCVRQGQVPE